MYGKKSQMAPKKLAFKILYKHRFTDGSSVHKSDYFETSDPQMIQNLTRSQGAFEVAAGSGPPAPAPPTQSEADIAAAEAARIAEANGETEKDPAPDFDRKTKTDLRRFLDFCGREQPKASVKHGTLVQECKAVWESGIRPSPFYGLPGGPVPSEGMPGPDASDPDHIQAAIDFAEGKGIEVPEETREALKTILEEKKAAEAQEAAKAEAEAAESETKTESEAEAADEVETTEASTPEE